MIVDSHCHLDFPELCDDLDGVVARAGQAGVGIIVTICTRLSRLDATLKIVDRFPQIFCAVGLHPHHVAEEGVPTVEQLVRIAAHPKVVGLGETGLDFFYDRSPRDIQEASFRIHIEAARQTGLPFIVHTRDADPETERVLVEECRKGDVSGLLHCFSSGRQLAETAIELGLYVSVSGIATFRTADEIRATLRNVPEDRLLVETDAPFLAPVPKRGKRNEPANVVLTAAAVATLKNMDADVFARCSTDNFFRVFAKVPRSDFVCA